MKLVLIMDDGASKEARCERCRHWDRRNPEFGEPSGFCRAISSKAGPATLFATGPADMVVLGTEPDHGCGLFHAPGGASHEVPWE
jgi:hypothetical protein